MNVEELNKLIKLDIGEQGTVKNPSLVQAVFPDEDMPFTVDEALLQKLTCDGRLLDLDTCMDRSKTHDRLSEALIAGAFNDIGSKLVPLIGKDLVRQWTEDTSSKPLQGSPHLHKPDMVLVKTPTPTPTDKLNWHQVLAFSEVTSESGGFHTRMAETLPQKVYIMFAAQDNRHFVPALSLYRRQFRLTVFDRSGVVHSPDFNINDDQLILLHILVALMFGEEELIGYDMSMGMDDMGQVKTVTMNGQVYNVTEKLFAAPTLRGRTTKCWSAQRGSQVCVIKDAWIHTERG